MTKKAKSPKKVRRSRDKHASLKQEFNPRIRQEYIDQDYIHKLDDTIKNCKLPNGKMVTQMEYLSLFMEEWNSASVGKQEDAANNIFHRTPEEVKECTDRNNHRNGDLYGNLKNKANKFNNKKLLNYDNIISDIENSLGRDSNPTYIEDVYIDFLDNKQVEKMLLEYDDSMKAYKEPLD